ncbi:MAG: hypothetical protein H0X43_13075 [Nitrosospira sp.]|nr:hypothetical protein [Nitrosospira sp.]
MYTATARTFLGVTGLWAVSIGSVLGQTALDDLKIEIEGKCQYFDYDRYVVVNTNTAKRVVANIMTDGDIKVHSYRDKDGSVQQDRYPKFRDYMLSPGKSQMIGCATANWRAVVIKQNFSIKGAYYPADDFTLPEKEKAEDYFRVYRTSMDICNGAGGEIAWFANSHPFKSITGQGKTAAPFGGGINHWQMSLPAMVSRNYECVGNPPATSTLESASFSSGTKKEEPKVTHDAKPIKSVDD